MLSYPALLDIATTETKSLKALVEALETELVQMNQHYLRMGWHRGFDDYYAQRREVSNQLDRAKIKLGDSRGRVMYYRRLIAAGEVRAA